MKNICYLIFVPLLLLGCSGIDVSKLSDSDMQRISEKLIVCEAPYIRHASDCCLDKNNNKVCDGDETSFSGSEENTINNNTSVSELKEECNNECISDSCSGKFYYVCTINEKGCKVKVNKGIVKDKCEVLCINNNNCKEGEICIDYSCFQKPNSLQTKYVLENYPVPLIMGGVASGKIIVGDEASSKDVAAATEISRSLSFIPVSLASEATDVKNINSILVGLPCTNKAMAIIFGQTQNCNEELEVGEGLIQLYSFNDKLTIVVRGYSSDEVRNAASVLANYQDYNLVGTKVKVRKINKELVVDNIS